MHKTVNSHVILFNMIFWSKQNLKCDVLDWVGRWWTKTHIMHIRFVQNSCSHWKNRTEKLPTVIMTDQTRQTDCPNNITFRGNYRSHRLLYYTYAPMGHCDKLRRNCKMSSYNLYISKSLFLQNHVSSCSLNYITDYETDCLQWATIGRSRCLNSLEPDIYVHTVEFVLYLSLNQHWTLSLSRVKI